MPAPEAPREFDAVVVGARCAGATLGLALARRGWSVLLVDRDTFPSETVSTHFLFPNTLARFDRFSRLVPPSRALAVLGEAGRD